MGGSCLLQAQTSTCMKRSQDLCSLTQGQGKALSGEATPILALEIQLLIASCVPSSLPRDAQDPAPGEQAVQAADWCYRGLVFSYSTCEPGCCVTFPGEK